MTGLAPADTSEGPSFSLGHIIVTNRAQKALEQFGLQPEMYLERHGQRDWGDVDADEANANYEYFEEGRGPIVSTYRFHPKNWNVSLTVYTDGNRRLTAVALTREAMKVGFLESMRRKAANLEGARPFTSVER